MLYQLSYRHYQRVGIEPATLTSLNEVVLVYGTLFYFLYFKEKGNKL